MHVDWNTSYNKNLIYLSLFLCTFSSELVTTHYLVQSCTYYDVLYAESLLIRLSTYQASALTCIHQIVLPVAHKLDMKQTHKLMGGMLTINLITG